MERDSSYDSPTMLYVRYSFIRNICVCVCVWLYWAPVLVDQIECSAWYIYIPIVYMEYGCTTYEYIYRDLFRFYFFFLLHISIFVCIIAQFNWIDLFIKKFLLKYNFNRPFKRHKRRQIEKHIHILLFVVEVLSACSSICIYWLHSCAIQLLALTISLRACICECGCCMVDGGRTYDVEMQTTIRTRNCNSIVPIRAFCVSSLSDNTTSSVYNVPVRMFTYES